MNPATQVTPFVWGDIALSQTVIIDGVPHATRAAIGEWLEYADPQKAIDNILTRNSYIEDHGTPLNLRGMDDAREYETTVYHPIGFLLIVMESGQPKAQAMKQAVAEFVWHFAGPRQLSTRTRIDLLKLRMALIDRLATVRDAFAKTALLADLREVSMAIGIAVPNAELIGVDVKQQALTGV